MRTLTVAVATWREAIRQPVSIIILVVAAAVTFMSQFMNLYHFDDESAHDIMRQMSVTQTILCGMVIAIFSASAVLADEIENRTVVTLLAKPVRRHEVVLGKFLGIMMAITAAFAIMVAVSLVTAWWAEAKVEKWRANPALVVTEAPALTTGQGALGVARRYADVATRVGGRGLDYAHSFGDLLLLSTGQASLLAARAPLAAQLETAPRGGMFGPEPKAVDPGLAGLVDDALRFAAERTTVLLEAFVLAFAQVMIMAAIAIAVSTRLPLVFNALFCTGVFVLGNLSRDLGQALAAADTGSGLGGVLLKAATWPAIAVCYALPNFQNFDMTDALSIGVDRLDPRVWTSGVLYGIIYTAIVLIVAVLLFRRREVA